MSITCAPACSAIVAVIKATAASSAATRITTSSAMHRMARQGVIARALRPVGQLVIRTSPSCTAKSKRAVGGRSGGGSQESKGVASC